MPRSTAVSVFGILNTAIGALGITGSFRPIAIFSSRAAANNPVTKDDVREPQFRDIDESAPSYRADHICSFADHWNWSLAAQTMGAESFNGYAIYAILFVLINVPINFFLLYWPMLEHGRQLQGAQGVVMIFAAILGTVGSVLGWVYPVLLCIFMTRPKFVAAFQSPPPLPASLP